MASKKEIDNFLKSQEQKAFKKINYQLQNEDDTLDIIQEAMIKVVQGYQDKDIKEIQMVFSTILHNCFIDFLRKKKSNTKILLNIDADFFDNESEEGRYLEQLQFENNFFEKDLEFSLEKKENLTVILEAIEQLPKRQSQAFVLRYIEELSIEETAQIMECSVGSVKTHCSRAAQSLQDILHNHFK